MHIEQAMEEADDFIMARWKEQLWIMDNSYFFLFFHFFKRNICLWKQNIISTYEWEI